MKRLPLLMSIVLCASSLIHGRQSTDESRNGVLVVRVDPGSPGSSAALRDGDRIIGWASEDGTPLSAFQPLPDPIAFERLEIAEGTRHRLRVAVLRGPTRIALTIAVAPWGVRIVPVLADGDRATYDAAIRAQASADAVQGLRELSARLRNSGNIRSAAWLRLQSGDARLSARKFAEAEADYGAALEWALAAADVPLEAEARGRQARALAQRGRGAEARQLYLTVLELEQRAGPDNLLIAEIWGRIALLPGAEQDEDRSAARRSLELRQQLAPGSPSEAAGWIVAGRVEMRRRQLDAAQADFDKAIALARLQPGSALLADALDQRGTVYQRRGALPESDADYQEEQRIRESVGAGSLAHANVLNNLGINASIRGELARADLLWAESARLYGDQTPDSLEMANVLNNQAINAMLRGRLDEAETILRESLAIKERVNAAPLEIATGWHNLGIANVERQDLETATTYFRRALDIRRTAAPGSNELASSLNNLAGVARRLNRLEEAEPLAREALELRRQSLPNSLELGYTLTELGRILRARGDPAGAMTAHREALTIRETRAPNSSSVAETLGDLGAIDLAEGRLAQARERADRSVALWQRLAPGTANEAGAHVLVAHVARATGNADEVLASLRAAVDALDNQSSHVGGTQEAQAQFRASVNASYGELMEELIARGQTAEAFHVLERSRARSFLAMLSDRELSFSALPPDIVAAQRKAAHDYEDIQDELASQNAATNDAEISRLLERLREVRATQVQLSERVRKAAPRVAALQYPAPLDVDAAARLLEPGTLLMAYAVGERNSYLFTLTRTTTVQVTTLGVTAAELRDRVSRFRRVIDQGRTRAAALDEVLAQGRSLGTTLLAPANAAITRAQRVLIVPDGPMYDLPFAALIRPDPGPSTQFLVEWRPIARTASMTTLADLRAPGPRAASAGGRFIGIGDPVADAEPLPGARRELDTLGALFGRDAVIATGIKATESLAKARTTDAKFVHFATHGIINATRSLDSGLILARSSGDNGLLQAWEVFEQMRTTADTVVLSGCDTGSGGVYAGEGLVGLTRAFQYAGARSVVASLWEVADEPTPDLMRRFYTSLRRGSAKDDALAQAQRQILSQPATRHPFFWASFVLDGERR